MKRLILMGLTLGALTGCGDRPARWDASTRLPIESVGLSGAVAVADPALDRVMMLSASSELSLANTPLRVGKNIVAIEPSLDRSTLFVLSRGVQPRLHPDDEHPSLTVIDGGVQPKVTARYSLTDPLQGIALDPEGQWAVVHDAGGLVVNPNELIFVNLQDPSSTPVSKTVRSFGGRPERLTFTSELTVPNGPPRRLLIVETERDVSLIDLSDLTRDEVTVLLPKTPSGATGAPAEVAVHDGAAGARIAVRLENDPNVVLLELGQPPAGDARPFKLLVNVADVGGVPSSIAFVQTDGGLRLAALVPTASRATLIDPSSSFPETVRFPRPFSRLTRVTGDLAAQPAGSDVALLWSPSTAGIAFWSLGKTSGTPYRSVDHYDIGIAVAQVTDIPGEQNAHLKLLESAKGAEFYVLDLNQRQSFPMLTQASGFSLSVSPDGERVWALRSGTRSFARILLSTLHPTSLDVERDVLAVYDVARRDQGRAVIALHASEQAGETSLGATVLDALEPDTARSRFFSGLWLGGLP